MGYEHRNPYFIRQGRNPAAINRQLSEIDIARGRQEAFARQHPAALESLKQVALIQSVEASNAIENITAPRKRLEELVAQRTTRRTGRRPRSPATGRPSEPSTPAPRASPSPRTSSASSTATSTSSQPSPAAAGRAWEAHRHHRLLLTGAYTLDFLVIHPFTDGSGRMSRLLSLLLLYHGGYEVGRFISIEKLIEESKETYYGALGRSTAGWPDGSHDLQPWLSYFLGVITAAYREFEPHAEAVTSGRGSKRELVKEFVRSNLSDTFTFADVKRAAPYQVRRVQRRPEGEHPRDLG